MAPPRLPPHRWSTAAPGRGQVQGDKLDLADYVPRIEPEPIVTCSACSVLEEQVRRALVQADAAHQQAELAHGAAFEAEEASLASTRAVAELRGERDTTERHRTLARRSLEERRYLNSLARARWEEEAAAWQALCSDNWSAAESTRKRLVRSEAHHEAEESVAAELMQTLDTTRCEVARLHTVQSSVEAQRLQDAECASTEAGRLRTEEFEARAREAGGRKSRSAAVEELAAFRNETVCSEALHAECRQRRFVLEDEVAAARAEAEMLREECAEASGSCRTLVGRINAEKQRGCPVTDGDQMASPALEAARTQLHRMSDVDPDRATIELKSKLQQALTRVSELKVENQRSKDTRREDAERHCAAIEHVRSKVSRYRGSCKELQRLTNERDAA